MPIKSFCLLLILGVWVVSVSSCKRQTADKDTPNVLPADVYFPEGFRSWAHVKSMIIEPGHPLYESFGGIHHLYANEQAMNGYRSGRFPDGSVIVFDLLEAHRKDSTVTEGNRKVVGVMYKNAQTFQQTGGWGFGAFSDMAGTRVQLDAQTACFNCHAARKDFDYVFSSYRE